MPHRRPHPLLFLLRVPSRAAVRIGVLVLALATIAFGCKDSDDGTKPVAADELPALTITDTTPGLMLTWLDTEGATHVELDPRDVPIGGRDLVRVVVDDRSEGQRDPIYVVDLNKKGADGSYAARSMARREWEREIEKRREALLAAARPPTAEGQSPQDPPSATGAVTVIIYGAEWCQPCHDAQDYLKSKNIPVLVKDVERDPRAQSEMQQKLAKVGRRGGSIPVLDVGGEIIVGFSPRAVDRALKKVRGGTAL